MITVRPHQERGYFDHAWLKTSHTFSFAGYLDPAHMGFRALRVINEDLVLPGEGFPTHPHRDMEIVTWVLDGALEHKDSMGNGSVIRPGDVQRMSAGTGITHSEFNHSDEEFVHFLQIWLLPERRGLTPGYEQRTLAPAGKHNRLLLVGSRDGRDNSVTIHQDVDLYASSLESGHRIAHALAEGRHAWLQVTRGGVTLNRRPLTAGDGAAVSAERVMEVVGSETSEFLLFDLA